MARIQEWGNLLVLGSNGFWETKNSATNGWSASRIVISYPLVQRFPRPL
jgi:hypothetical protein